MNLTEISWPVFRLGEHKPHQDDGVIYYSKEYVDNESEDSRVGLRIVDDKTIPGNNLGMRRLLLASDEEVKLFKIKTAIYFLADLIKIAKQTTWFIDSSGKVFQYRKSTRAKLTFHKIKQILPGTGMGAVIVVEGLSQRFKCMYRPKDHQEYVGVLRYGLGYLLYGFYDEYHKPTHRLV